jgi:hypothetical protein
VGRRTFLAGAAAAALMAGCSTPSSSNEGLVPAAAGRLVMVALFAASGGEAEAGSVQRLPFAFADRAGLLVTDVPETVEVRVVRGDEEVLSPAVVRVRREGLPRPYVPVFVRPREPGLHRLIAQVGDQEAEATFLVDPATSSRPANGERLPSVATPTYERPRGVSPVCTRTPACPLHEITVSAALRERRPLAVLVASPGTCRVTFCPPALELVLDARDRHPGVRFLHAEVYLDATDTSSLARTTEIVHALGIEAEPSLFLVGADGRLQHRLDHVFDASELDEGLASLQ